MYSPVGVIGASKGATIVEFMDRILPQHYNANNYNCIGPFMMREVLKIAPEWSDKMYNTPKHFFYPIYDSCFVNALYEGENYEQFQNELDHTYFLGPYGSDD